MSGSLSLEFLIYCHYGLEVKDNQEWVKSKRREDDGQSYMD